jgi:hypothetical protein
MVEHVLFYDDPLVVTRFIGGTYMWVSRWYWPVEGIPVEVTAAAATSLICRRGSRPLTRRPFDLYNLRHTYSQLDS